MTSPAPGTDPPPASGGGSVFAIKPWYTSADRQPRTLSDFIARVGVERGGFRNVTLDKLEQEIREQDEAAIQGDAMEEDTEMGLEDGDNHNESDEDEDEGSDQDLPSDDVGEVADVYEAKARILQDLEYVL